LQKGFFALADIAKGKNAQAASRCIIMPKLINSTAAQVRRLLHRLSPLLIIGFAARAFCLGFWLAVKTFCLPLVYQGFWPGLAFGLFLS